MRNRETRFVGKEIVESQSDKKSSSKSQDSSSMSEKQKLRKWIGVGYAAKVAGLGALALTGGTRADTSPGTDLALREKNETTALHPYSEGAQIRPQREFNPDAPLTPEGRKHFKKIGVTDPERFIENVQKRDYPQSIQKREQRQKQRMQRLVKEARDNPDVLKSLSNLFKDEIPEKESHEIDRIKLDKGTERLTPDKIAPEVWMNVRRMLTEKQRNLDDNSGTTIVLVHGITGRESYGSSNGVDCTGGYWGDAITFLKGGGRMGQATPISALYSSTTTTPIVT
jgi:broad specificity phosphatase PhoE